MLVCAIGAVLAAQAGLVWFSVVLVVTGIVALLDPAWASYRRWRGEPG